MKKKKKMMIRERKERKGKDREGIFASTEFGVGL